jgi:hypothetical protein
MDDPIHLIVIRSQKGGQGTCNAASLIDCEFCLQISGGSRVVFLRNVLRVYSWIYETILCFLAIAVAAAVVISGDQNLHIGWLPWRQDRLMAAMLLIGIGGILSVLLAITGKVRILLFLFSLYALYLLVSGLFLNMGYSFTGPVEARNALLVTAGAALAVIGAWPAAINKR